jgi:hypothetical protein
MSSAKPADIGGGATDSVILVEPDVVVEPADSPDDEVIDLTGLEDTLEYEVLPRPLLGAYLIG